MTFWQYLAVAGLAWLVSNVLLVAWLAMISRPGATDDYESDAIRT